MMEFCLQFGYGMMGHTRELLERWGGGGAILSPRDLTGEQLTRLGGQICDIPNSEVLIDPQLYLPHSSHERLSAHAFWPSDYDSGKFWGGPGLTKMLSALRDCNREAGASRIILPGVLAGRVDDTWFGYQESTLEEGLKICQGHDILCTLALQTEVLSRPDQIGELLEQSETWPVKSYYLVCEHPNGDYLVQDANWLASLLDLIAGLRLRGCEVILGYANHQMLIAACAKVSAIASGTWMNVRAFPPEKFESKMDDEIKQRATWYYCPQALSEYKLPFLDIAHRQKMLGRLAPSKGFSRDFVEALFSGAQPSTIPFTEQQAFRHYLDCLRLQAHTAAADSFDETVNRHETVLNEADTLLKTLRAGGVMGQMRDFSEIIDVNRAALAFLKGSRGPMLRRKWATL